MAARNLCVAVVVVAATVVLAMERNIAKVVMMLSRAMPCVEKIILPSGCDAIFPCRKNSFFVLYGQMSFYGNQKKYEPRNIGMIGKCIGKGIERKRLFFR